ncbi:MAG: hypothetical protein ABI175_17535, partial [Polyangiales bacterium]
MATRGPGSEHLRQRGGIWYGTVYVDGRRAERSTGCTDKKAARAVLAQWERDAADPAARAATTLNDALNLLLDTTRAAVAQGDKSAKTLSFYDEKAGHLVAVLGHDLSIATITDSTISWRYIDARRKENVIDRTIKKELGTLRTALALAKERGLFSGPLDVIVPRKFRPPPPPKGDSITRANAAKIFPHLLPDAAAIMAFVLATGAEDAALRFAKRSDLRSKGAVFIRGTKNDRRSAIVPIV